MRATEVIVVGDDVPRSQFEDIAHDWGWERTGLTERAHLVMARVQYSPVPGQTATWVENHTSDVRTIRVHGKPEPVRSVAAELRESIPNEPRSALLQAATVRSGPAGLIRLAGKLADSRPARCDPAHLDALRRLLSHDVIAVRRAAVRTAYAYTWPELLPLVLERYEVEDVLDPQLEHLASFLKSRL